MFCMKLAATQGMPGQYIHVTGVYYVHHYHVTDSMLCSVYLQNRMTAKFSIFMWCERYAIQYTHMAQHLHLVWNTARSDDLHGQVYLSVFTYLPGSVLWLLNFSPKRMLYQYTYNKAGYAKVSTLTNRVCNIASYPIQQRICYHRYTLLPGVCLLQNAPRTDYNRITKLLWQCKDHMHSESVCGLRILLNN